MKEDKEKMVGVYLPPWKVEMYKAMAAKALDKRKVSASAAIAHLAYLGRLALDQGVTLAAK